MTITDYLRVLREQWLVVAVAALLGIAAGAALFLVRTPTYTSTVTLYVSSRASGDAIQQAQGAQLSQQRVASYVELVGGRRVAEDVVAKLGLDETPDALRKQIVASSTLQSVLIDVAVTDPSPQRAQTIAAAVGDVFTGIVDDLERPSQPDQPQAVSVRVVEPAEVPDRPSSTGLPTLLVVGLIAGTALGVAVAVVRNALDTTVGSLAQLQELSGAPNLGTIAYDRAVPQHPLTVQEAPQSPRAEAFRQLRTNLQFVDIQTPHTVVAVTSSLPGEGKTTTVTNLAIASASSGVRVLVVEADLRRPTLSRLLGLDRSAGITTVLAGRATVDQVVQPWGNGQVHLLAAGALPPNPSELLGSRQMAELLAALRPEYDLIIIDTPPLLPVTDAAALAPFLDGVLLVCRFGRTTRAELAAAVEALRVVSAPLLGTVFSMVPQKGPRALARYNAYYPSAGGAPRSQAPEPQVREAQVREAQLNSRPATGRQVRGTQVDGGPVNGSPVNGKQADGSPGNGGGVNGSGVNGSPLNGRQGNGHPAAGQPGNGQAGNGEVGNGQVGNGQVGNGQVGNGRPVRTQPGQAHQTRTQQTQPQPAQPQQTRSHPAGPQPAPGGLAELEPERPGRHGRADGAHPGPPPDAQNVR